MKTKKKRNKKYLLKQEWQIIKKRGKKFILKQKWQIETEVKTKKEAKKIAASFKKIIESKK
jgi:hypothetical protein